MATTLKSCVHISDFKEYSTSLDISHSKLHLKTRLSFSSDYNFIINGSSITNKYYPKILAVCYDRTFNDLEFLQYKFQPKKYCYDEYGTTELWSLLLKINNMTSAMEFTKKTIKVFDGDRLIEILNDILILEANNITLNKERAKLI